MYHSGSQLVESRLSKTVNCHVAGSIADDLGDKQQARTYYERALAITQAMGAKEGEGVTLNNLGSLAYSQGDIVAARTYSEQALAIFEQIGAVDYARAVQENLAVLHDDAIAERDSR